MKDWLNIISEKLCGGMLMLCVACQNRTGKLVDDCDFDDCDFNDETYSCRFSGCD